MERNCKFPTCLSLIWYCRVPKSLAVRRDGIDVPHTRQDCERLLRRHIVRTRSKVCVFVVIPGTGCFPGPALPSIKSESVEETVSATDVPNIRPQCDF